MRPPLYLVVLALSTSCVIVGAGLLAWLVDPYALYKPERGDRAVFEMDIAQKKLFHAVGRGVNGVVLGNSRVDVGFDPRHPLFTGLGGRAHNLGIPGAGIEASASQLIAICATHRLETVVVGVEFADFIYPRDRTPETFRPLPMRTTPSTRDFAKALVSGEATVDSFRTLVAVHSDRINRQTPDGMNQLNAYAAETSVSGYGSFFKQRLGDYARRFARTPWRAASSSDAAVGALRALISVSQACGSRVYFVMYPYHFQYLALVHKAGLWSMFEAWKRLVVAEVRDLGLGNVDIVDAARVSPASLQVVPLRGDVHTLSPWYWEAGHFKRELGHLVLSAAMGDLNATLLTRVEMLCPENLDFVLESDRRALEEALLEREDLDYEVTKALRGS